MDKSTMPMEAWKFDKGAAMGVAGNKTLVCQADASVGSRGYWFHQNPFQFSTPLLLLQLSLTSATTMLFDSILRPLGQSTIVSQFLGGLLFGPSLLGHDGILGGRVFPPRGSMTFETTAAFGLIFFLFIIGLKCDAGMMIRPGRKAMITGLSVMFVPLGLTISLSLLLVKHIPMDHGLADTLHLVAFSQCLTAFPNISCILTELKILNTDLGRLAMSASMFCDMIGIFLTAIGFAILFSSSALMSVLGISSFFGLLLIVVYIVRPLTLRYIVQRAKEEKLREIHITTILLMVMIVGLASEMIGQHYVLGPLLLGLAIPEGPPLGSALVEKLHYPIVKVLYPTYLTASGLKTNIFTIHWQSLWIIGLLCFVSSLVKIGTVILVACFTDMPTRDAFVVGLMLNAKGISELTLYNLWVLNEVMTKQEFALNIIFVILTTAIITPLIKYLYDPSKKLRPLKRRTIQHAKGDEELRILVCIHNQDSVPSIMNLLEASHATEESPIAVIGVILIELVGRTAPMLIAHQSDRTLEPSTSRSGQIIKALRNYESYNKGRVTVQSYTSISHFETMHDDICGVALDQNANIVIIPFHKTWEIDGNVGHVNRAIKGLNLRVLEKIPCTVGIHIDRGNLKGSLSILNPQSIYNIGVIYIGGLDDIESLCYGARMVKHENVTLTVIRFLLFGCDNARERKFDNNLIDEIRHSNMGNSRFMYQEEVVRDGVGLASCIRQIEDGFDLLLVGKHHQDSPLLAGLDTWSECPELGVIGDLLASQDLATTTSVLVVKQQRVGGKLISRSMKPVVLDTHVHGVPRVTRTSSSASNYTYNDNNNNNNNNNDSLRTLSVNKD